MISVARARRDKKINLHKGNGENPVDAAEQLKEKSVLDKPLGAILDRKF